MRNLILILVLTSIFTGLGGQSITLDLKGTVEKKIVTIHGEPLFPGTNIAIEGIARDILTFPYAIFLTTNETSTYISPRDLSKIKLDTPENREVLWQTLCLSSGSYNQFLTLGEMQSLRNRIIELSLAAITDLNESYGFLRDDLIEMKMRSMLQMIHPPVVSDSRPGVINLKVMKLNEPFAVTTPDGTIIVSTGLVSSLNTEQELLALLSLEVAHFILDHNFQNLNSDNYRNNFSFINDKRSFASVFYNFGANYSADQMKEAENAAREVLIINKLNPDALPMAINRIRSYYENLRVSLNASPARGYAGLNSVVVDSGVKITSIIEMRKYDAVFSYAITLSAGSELSLNRFKVAIDLVDRNIDAGTATEDDYLIKIMALEALSDSPERSMQTLELVHKAKSLGILPNNYLNKQEALILIRLGRNNEAAESLEIYLDNLTSSGDNSTFITEEIQWARRMLGKITKLQD